MLRRILDRAGDYFGLLRIADSAQDPTVRAITRGTVSACDDIIFRKTENNKTIPIDTEKNEIASGALKGTKVSPSPDPAPENEKNSSLQTGPEHSIIYADRKITGYIEAPKTLGDTTHREKYDDLIAHGVDVTPLTEGSQKDKPYEQGGGYKVVSGTDGRLLMYHPNEGSHHGGEYYKLASGKTGKKRYDMNGDTIKE